MTKMDRELEIRQWMNEQVDREYMSHEAVIGRLNEKKKSFKREFFEAYKYVLSYVPHPIQYQFHGADNKIRAFYGGPRSGKSTAGVMEMIWWCLGIHPYLETPDPPIFARSVAPDIKRSFWRILWPKYRTFCGEVGGELIESFLRERMVLKFKNGSEIEFMSYEQDINKFAGQALHIIHFDEEPLESIYMECLNRTIDYDGRAILTFTPMKGYVTWSNRAIRANLTKDPIIMDSLMRKHGMSKEAAEEVAPRLVATFDCDTKFNPYNKLGSFEKVKALVGEDQFTGSYVPKSGLIFGEEWNEVEHTKKDIPDGWSYDDFTIYVGIDHQEYRNPEGILIIGVDKYNRIWVLDEIYERNKTVAGYAALIKEALMGYCFKYTCIIDSNAETEGGVTGKSARMEYATHGIGTIIAKKGPGSMMQGIGKLKDYFKADRILILRRCRVLIQQLNEYAWQEWHGKTRDLKNPKERPVEREDHLIDALRYVVHMEPRYRPPEFQVPHQPNEGYKPRSSKTGY